MLQVSSKYTASSPYDKSWNDQAEALRDDDTSDKAAGFVSTQNFLHSPSLSAGVGVVVKASAQCASSCSGSCCSGLQRLMEDTSCCGTSFAVDCTLSLGTAASRPDIPARLSRAGSPAQDHAWPHSARPEQVDAAMRRTCEQDRLEQGISWGGSRGGGDPSPLPEYFSQATGSGRGARGGDGMQRSGSSGWPSFCVQSTKEESGTQAGLLSMLDNHSFDSLPARQSWLPTFMSSNGASAECKNNIRGQDRCLQEGSSMVRVCAHCGTTKTPLWRNGPQGPKSLCNACGIRFKKAGRRSAASASSELQSCSPPVVTTGKVGKRKLEEAVGQEYWVYPEDARPRKRSRGVFLRPTDSLLSGGSCMTWQPCLLTPSPQSSLQRDCHATPLPRNQEKNLVQMGAFSTDEEEGAVLLMALSCGLVHA